MRTGMKRASLSSVIRENLSAFSDGQHQCDGNIVSHHAMSPQKKKRGNRQPRT